MTKSDSVSFKTVLMISLLVILAVFCALPFVLILGNSLKTNSELYTLPPTIFPFSPTISNYFTSLFEKKFLTYLRNSLFVSAVNACLTLAISIPAAYSLARFRFRGRNALSVANLLVNDHSVLDYHRSIVNVVPSGVYDIPTLGTGGCCTRRWVLKIFCFGQSGSAYGNSRHSSRASFHFHYLLARVHVCVRVFSSCNGDRLGGDIKLSGRVSNRLGCLVCFDNYF
jgi:hypothetical protein